MPAHSDTKTRLLEAAYTLMLSKGYPATTVDEICKEAGVSKGSFYHFFRTKQDMTLEVLGHHVGGAKEELERGLDLENCPANRRAIEYVKHLEERAEDIWRDGCLIGSLALELADTHPEVRETVSRIFRDLTTYFEPLFVPVCDSCSRFDVPSPRELAEQLVVVIEGGVVLSRAHRDKGQISQALRGFRRYLEMLI